MKRYDWRKIEEIWREKGLVRGRKRGGGERGRLSYHLSLLTRECWDLLIIDSLYSSQFYSSQQFSIWISQKSSVSYLFQLKLIDISVLTYDAGDYYATESIIPHFNISHMFYKVTLFIIERYTVGIRCRISLRLISFWEHNHSKRIQLLIFVRY